MDAARLDADGLIMETTDPKRMNLYRRDFPAGPVKLGANRDGVNQGKGNYLVIIQPKLLAPRARRPRWPRCWRGWSRRRRRAGGICS